nr:MAG TPA: hypothetical protein [Caudoviricetes sp.]
MREVSKDDCSYHLYVERQYNTVRVMIQYGMVKTLH